LNPQDTEFFGLAILILAIALLFLFALDRRSKRKQHFRQIPGLLQLKRSIGETIEQGNRIHVSLGSAGLPAETSASALAGLGTLRSIAQFSSLGDLPPESTSGNGSLALLSKETLRKSFSSFDSTQLFDPDNGRMTGVTPFSYALGAIPVVGHEKTSTNLVIGHFGPEAAYLCDAARRQNAFLLGGSDALPAQAVLYVSADDSLIGEETFATAAYLDKGVFQTASLRTQDVLRWVLIIIMIVSVIDKIVTSLTGRPWL
jgi:hypothetical protein